MAVRDTVRDAQRRIATLDAAHRRAVAHLDRTRAHRADIVAAQDRIVASSQDAVDQVVAEMASSVGIELTATVLGINPTEVRRLTKASAPTPDPAA
jgi:hypothetical protein